MNITFDEAALTALSADVLADRQSLVDKAVRASRAQALACGEFTRMMAAVLPEFLVTIDGARYVFDSDGGTCTGHTIANITANANRTTLMYDADGFDQHGYDRDGYGHHGYDRESRDANGFYESQDRSGRFATGYLWDDDVDAYLDRDGNRRVGRPATPEEAAAEAARSSIVIPNPTTWTHPAAVVGAEGPSTDDAANSEALTGVTV